MVWFGEMLPPAALDAASRATGACDLFLSIGTSSLVYPAAALPYEALENGATLVEINPNETPLTPHADYSLRGAAGQVLPDLYARFMDRPLALKRRPQAERGAAELPAPVLEGHLNPRCWTISAPQIRGSPRGRKNIWRVVSFVGSGSS